MLSKFCSPISIFGLNFSHPQTNLFLNEFQRDEQTSTHTFFDADGLFASPCSRRVKRQEEDILITRYAAIPDGKKLGLTALAHILVFLVDQDASSLYEAQTFVD
ncbi:MAG: Lrp/AsnC family transcriptional regulator [Sulfitobacter sp.]